MAFTPEQMLDVLRRTCDETYLAPMLEDPDSRAVLTALANIASRMSYAADRTCQQGLLSEASPGSPGTTIVNVSRPIEDPGRNTIPKGTLFEDARGVKYVLNQSVALPIGIFNLQTFALQTLRKTYSVNTVDDPDIRFSPVFIVGEVSNTTPIKITTTTKHNFVTNDQVQVRDCRGNTSANGFWEVQVIDAFNFLLLGSTGVTDNYTLGGIVFPNPVFVNIDSSTPTSGGASAYLNVLGKERGVQRQEQETDASYRARVRNIPDAVSPRGILEAINGAAQFGDLPQMFLEEPFVTNADPLVMGNLGLRDFKTLYYDTGFQAGFNPSFAGTQLAPFAYAWDELISTIPDAHAACGFFRIVPAGIPINAETSVAFWDSMFWDDDVAAYWDTFFSGTIFAGFNAIFEEVQRKRAACVKFDMVIPAVREFYSQFSLIVPPTFILFYVLEPPAGSLWWLWELIAAHIKNQVPLASSVPEHFFAITFEDNSVYQTPFYTKFDTQRITQQNLIDATGGIKRVKRVEGFMQSGDNIESWKLLTILRVVEVPA